jgi:hypothetical protein
MPGRTPFRTATSSTQPRRTRQPTKNVPAATPRENSRRAELMRGSGWAVITIPSVRPGGETSPGGEAWARPKPYRRFSSERTKSLASNRSQGRLGRVQSGPEISFSGRGFYSPAMGSIVKEPGERKSAEVNRVEQCRAALLRRRDVSPCSGWPGRRRSFRRVAGEILGHPGGDLLEAALDVAVEPLHHRGDLLAVDRLVMRIEL